MNLAVASASTAITPTGTAGSLRGLGICGPSTTQKVPARWTRVRDAGLRAVPGGPGTGAVNAIGFGRPGGGQRCGACIVGGFRPGLLNRRTVGAAELGRSHPADQTRRGSMAEYPPRCHPDGPGSEPGKPAQRNAFGEYGPTRHRRCCPSGPAHDHHNCRRRARGMATTGADTALAAAERWPSPLSVGRTRIEDVNPEPIRSLGSPTLMAPTPDACRSAQ